MAEVIIKKVKITAEDLETGLGNISQERGGVTSDYSKINSGVIPHTDGTPLDEIVDAKAEQADFSSHIGDTANPHAVTKTQVGLGNVDNTADLDKPISTATQAAFDLKADTNDVLSISTSNPPYNPLYEYSPATKKYVLDTVTAIGAGDMAKAVYDTTDNGIVDNSEALGGYASSGALIDKGTITDADAITETGMYTGTDVLNAPGSGYIVLEYFHYGDTSFQRCFVESTKTWYIRLKNGLPTQIWQSWKNIFNADKLNGQLASFYATDSLTVHNTGDETVAGVKNFTSTPTVNGDDIFNQGNILGTVSQSGGIPTGAIIERGSNANGEYVKFADGTLICTHIVSLQVTAIDTVETKVWNFPSSFIAAPIVSGEIMSNATTFLGNRTLLFKSSILRGSTRSNPLTAVEIFVSGNNSGVNTLTDFIAIGRWF